MCEEPSVASSPPGSPPPNVAPIPGSLSDACVQATAAIKSSAAAGRARMFVDIDTSNGDETYTLLKKSLPVVRLVAPTLLRPLAQSDYTETTAPALATVHVLLPDSGAAALLARDWGSATPEGIRLAGLEEADIDPEKDAAVVIVTPRASEVENLQIVVEAAVSLPVVVICPDLVDMGVTGLSLNARQLRDRFIDTFEEAYFLRTYPWGALLRQYPGNWGLWVDAPGTEVGFRLVKELETKPNSTQVDEILESLEEVPKQGMLQGMLSGFSRFLKVYTKG